MALDKEKVKELKDLIELREALARFILLFPVVGEGADDDEKKKNRKARQKEIDDAIGKIYEEIKTRIKDFS